MRDHNTDCCPRTPRSWLPDLPAHAAAPTVTAPGQDKARGPGICAVRRLISTDEGTPIVVESEASALTIRVDSS